LAIVRVAKRRFKLSTLESRLVGDSNNDPDAVGAAGAVPIPTPKREENPLVFEAEEDL
jgi:hypothetical protein